MIVKVAIVLLWLTTNALAQTQMLGPGLWYDATTGTLTANNFSGTATTQDLNDVKAKLSAMKKLQKLSFKNCVNPLTGKTKPLC